MRLDFVLNRFYDISVFNLFGIITILAWCRITHFKMCLNMRFGFLKTFRQK